MDQITHHWIHTFRGYNRIGSWVGDWITEASEEQVREDADGEPTSTK